MSKDVEIFLSYARADSKIVNRLAQRLRDANYRVWLDTEGIDAGQHWREKIVEAIDRADTFLIAISPNSVESADVRRELDLADEKGKRIVPIVLWETSIPKDMQLQLAGTQRIDLEHNFDNGLAALMKAAQGTVGRPRTGVALASCAGIIPVFFVMLFIGILLAYLVRNVGTPIPVLFAAASLTSFLTATLQGGTRSGGKVLLWAAGLCAGGIGVLMLYTWGVGASTDEGRSLLMQVFLLAVSIGATVGMAAAGAALSFLLGVGHAANTQVVRAVVWSLTPTFAVMSTAALSAAAFGEGPFADVGTSDMTPTNTVTGILLGLSLASMVPLSSYIARKALAGDRRFVALDRMIRNSLDRDR